MDEIPKLCTNLRGEESRAEEKKRRAERRSKMRNGEDRQRNKKSMEV